MRASHSALLLLLAVPTLALCAGTADFSGMTADYDVDVCVLGGGPSGTAAAIAAARNGVDTLLVEQYGFLGGMGTAASVNVFMDYRFSGGIFREILHELDKLEARRGSVFDANIMRVALDNLVQDAGVKVLFHTRGVTCTIAPGRSWQGKQRQTISSLLIHNKSGLQKVRAKVFIDCTGDADLAAWAGAPFEIGRKEDGETQPMTMIFRMGGCTFKGGSIMKFPGMEDYWASYAFNPNPGEISLNMTRIQGYSGINGEDLTAATIEGRKAVMEAVEALRKNVPGFQDAYLLAMPAQIGVRETRRVMGATLLTGEQLINPGRIYSHRKDVVARNQYNVDIHDPKGTKAQIVRLKQPYEIPYRCLLPKGVDNLLIAGRPISADHVAHSSLRIQPTCYALGQAAGTAAALAVANETGPWEVGQPNDPTKGQALLRELQAVLIRQGQDLGATRARELGLYPEWRRWQLKYRLEAYPLKRAFKDVPDDHPAHEAVQALAGMGVLRGLSADHYGADDPASIAVSAVVIGRCMAVLPSSRAPLYDKVPLPDRLKGKWWSSAIAECAAYGILDLNQLPGIEPEDYITEQDLRRYLERAFPQAAPLPPVPTELLKGDTITRASLAYLAWAAARTWEP